MKLQWSKSTYTLNWNDASKEVQQYTETTDGSDVGCWKLPSSEELRSYAKVAKNVDAFFWTDSEGLSCSLVHFLKDNSTSLHFKKNKVQTVFVKKVTEKN